jgi:DNA-directed RNA polymerase subunit K/omega
MEKLTKFEIAKVIGARAVQLSKGAASTIDIGTLDNAMDIAYEEYRQKMIPFLITRAFPDGNVEEIDPNDDKYRVGTT